MRIAIDLNNVLRDTFGKFQQQYEKHLVETNDDMFIPTYTIDISGNTELEVNDETFEYKILSPITSPNLDEHFSFKNKEEFYSFMYEEHCMEIFGHAPSKEMSTFNDLNTIYHNLRKIWDFIVISEEVGKSKPASLFFLSKFGCEMEKVIFYSNFTENKIWNEFDVLLTANPKLLLNHPEKIIVIKYETEYNKDINKYHSIKKIEDLELILKTISQC